MKVVIFGAGAVGLGLASCLVSSGARVHFVVRSAAHRDQLLQNGFTRTGLFGDVRIEKNAFEVSDRIEDIAEANAEVWLVCTKSNASESLARRIAPIFAKLTATPQIVLCQNGWGNAEHFAARMTHDRIFNARIITGFERTSTTSVDITVHADSVHIGSLFGADTLPLRPLCEAIARGGLPCELSQKIEEDLFAKLLYNCLLNPLGALVGVPYGVLGERPETRSLMANIAMEIFAVLDASRRRTHWRTAGDYLEIFYEKLLPQTARHHSSMLQDLRAGRTSEIDALCGAVCRLGAEHVYIGAKRDSSLHVVLDARPAYVAAETIFRKKL